MGPKKYIGNKKINALGPINYSTDTKNNVTGPEK